MKQISLADAEYAGKRKKTRREVFLDEMEQVASWKVVLKKDEPFNWMAGIGHRAYPLATMLRVSLIHDWFALRGPAMERRCTRLRRCATLPD